MRGNDPGESNRCLFTTILVKNKSSSQEAYSPNYITVNKLKHPALYEQIVLACCRIRLGLARRQDVKMVRDFTSWGSIYSSLCQESILDVDIMYADMLASINETLIGD